MKLLSFCITCKNRMWQLSETLPKNLEYNKKFKSKIEFVLVDFESKESLASWVKKEFTDYLKEGYLKFYSTNKLLHWHASVAKNTSHLWSTGKFVVNLDCDNLTGKNGGEFVLNSINQHKYPVMIHQFSGDMSDGSFGRITLRKDIFCAIGGYDESFDPMGWQDIDLLARLWAMGVEYIHLKDRKYNRAIKNTKDESIAFCNSQKTYNEMNLANQRISYVNLFTGKSPIRNYGNFGIREGVYDYNGCEINLELAPSLGYEKLLEDLKLAPRKDLSYIKQLLFPNIE